MPISKFCTSIWNLHVIYNVYHIIRITACKNKRSQDHNVLASLLSLGFSVVMMSAMIAMLLTAFFMMPFMLRLMMMVMPSIRIMVVYPYRHTIHIWHKHVLPCIGRMLHSLSVFFICLPLLLVIFMVAMARIISAVIPRQQRDAHHGGYWHGRIHGHICHVKPEAIASGTERKISLPHRC